MVKRIKWIAKGKGRAEKDGSIKERDCLDQIFLMRKNREKIFENKKIHMQHLWIWETQMTEVTGTGDGTYLKYIESWRRGYRH